MCVDGADDHEMVDVAPLGGRDRHFEATPDCYPNDLPGCSYRPPVLSWTASAAQEVDGCNLRPDEHGAAVDAGELRRPGLSVRLDGGGRRVDIDLSQLSVFDCRVDCFPSIGDLLGAVGEEEQLCIGWLGIRGGHQDGRLWVNRYTWRRRPGHPP